MHDCGYFAIFLTSVCIYVCVGMHERDSMCLCQLCTRDFDSLELLHDKVKLSSYLNLLSAAILLKNNDRTSNQQKTYIQFNGDKITDSYMFHKTDARS